MRTNTMYKYNVFSDFLRFFLCLSDYGIAFPYLPNRAAGSAGIVAEDDGLIPGGGGFEET